MNRKPNTVCFYCNKPIYRRPGELRIRKIVYCSFLCKTTNYPKRKCLVCSKEFKPSHSKNKLCSRSCTGASRTGSCYNKSNTIKYKSMREYRFKNLMEKFNFKSCMVEGCNYNRVYDIHRFIAGRNGGKYEVGNMFAICPNHHAEIERNIIKVEKVNDFTLRILEGYSSQAQEGGLLNH